MVDITQIELNPIPLPVIELQKANEKLHAKNRTLRNVLIGFGVIGLVFITYKYIKQIQDENTRQNRE